MKKNKTAIFAFALVAAASAMAEIEVVPRPAEVNETEGFYELSAPVVDVARFTKDASIPKEGYRLTVSKDGIAIAYGDDAGRFYALQTLKQMAKSEGGRTVVQCVEIKDDPRY